MILNKNILFGVGLGVGVISLVAIFIKEKGRLPDYLPHFKNFFGGKYMLTGYPRGVKNNNPGNIEKTKTIWKGEIPHAQNTDKRFKQFYNYTYGIRGIILNLKAYRNMGITTPRQIISRWSPPSENNTEGYIKYVSQYIRVPENVAVPFEKHTIKKLTEAIIIKENGKLYFKSGDFENAWQMI